MRLWDIDEEIEKALSLGTDPDTGLLTEEALAKVESLEMEREATHLGLARYAKGEATEAAILRAQIQATRDALNEQLADLEQRAKIHEGRNARIVEHLLEHLKDRPDAERKLKDAVVRLRWGASVAVEIENEDAVPKEFWSFPPPPPPKPDKAKIKKAGGCDGARVEKRPWLKVE